jgi:hypothetical protein
MFGDREKLGDNRFRVELEQFRDRKEVNIGGFEVKNESLQDREELDDDEFDVKSEPLAESDDEYEVEVKKTSPRDEDIDWNHLWRGDRFDLRGRRCGIGWDPFYWLNNKYFYFIIGGFVLGSIIGLAIADMLADGLPDTEIVEYGALVGFVIGCVSCVVYAGRLIYKNRRARKELEKELDDDGL